MTDLVYGHDAEVADFLSDKLGMTFVPPYVCIGVVRNGRLIGGILYNGYQGSNVDVTVWGPRAFGRDTILIGFHYAFEQLKCERITVRTKRSNKLMQKIAPKLGLKFECVSPRFFGRNEDAIVYRVFRDECRWMDHGFSSQSAAA